MTQCIYSTVSERDMDRMFMEAIATDAEFAKSIIDTTALKGNDFSIVSVELSRTDAELGESDITVIADFDGHKHAFLIEDKIDAIAMKEQSNRYKKRGDMGVRNGEYESYETFIFCPEKYYELNDEAKKYSNVITYEKHLEYFRGKDDAMSRIRCQQLEQAITKAKKPPQVIFNEAANSYFKKYREYQKTYYPELDMRTQETSNGYWVKYGTRFGRAYIYHKLQEGYADLTFPETADQLGTLQWISSKLKAYKVSNASAVRTAKSSALRIYVNGLHIDNTFEETPIENLTQCFEAIKELADIAGFFADIRSMEHAN